MMTNYEDRDYDAKEGRSRVWKDDIPPPTAFKRIQDPNFIRTVEKCVIRDHMILNKKGVDSGVNPSVMDTIDLSKATCKEARRACNSIFVYSFGKYKKVHAFVEFVTRTNNRDKIILRIQNQKIWRIGFSLHDLTWPKDEERYADEAIELLRTTVSQRWVEVELETIDKDGYFVGYLLESNTNVAIPILEAGLAKLNVWSKNYAGKLYRAEEYAREKKLKIWENYH